MTYQPMPVLLRHHGKHGVRLRALLLSLRVWPVALCRSRATHLRSQLTQQQRMRVYTQKTARCCTSHACHGAPLWAAGLNPLTLRCRSA